ncbi:hypothetical protein ZWY2020_039399 [Hordeum vulgare]|nr:hypothetical protein ZWY2020_039399 [Hordeum vulgare]
MRWNWETPTTETKAEALQERIWDLHDKLRHAILALSACAGLPACRCRGAPMADTRGLHTIRAALEDLEGHLHFLRGNKQGQCNAADVLPLKDPVKHKDTFRKEYREKHPNVKQVFVVSVLVPLRASVSCCSFELVLL